MSRSIQLLPKHQRRFLQFGERLKLARLRRRLSAELLAERAGISRATLYKIEGGEPNVAMGSYFQVLRVLGLEDDFEQLANDDAMGRKLQDLDLVTRRRAPKQKVLDE
ncbi:MAG: transcriptional regulator with XRE-family HTH domain [Zhongshania aliphaticivorans]|jgi:transcriptional regulator with XRE-family HTH domain